MKATFRFAALAVAVLAACGGDTPGARMRAVAARGGRTVEARLSGFAWSPIHVQRGTPALDPARLELAGAAGAVIEKNPSGRDAGIGYLIIDRDAEAVEALQDAAQQSPNDAKIWSDLAAARYTLAARGDKPYELPRALAAADHALRLSPDLADALFNRALIVERLGISEAARRAWQRYLQTDGTTKWADEALQHLGRLDVVNTRAQFERELARARAALANGDAAPVAAITRTFPQEARTWGEGPLLAEWADAQRAGDSARAQKVLALVQAIARTLVDSNHERLLADTISAIESADPQRQQTVATAYDLYRRGRILYSQRKVDESNDFLRRSASLFAEAGNPMRYMAQSYVAQSLYDSNHAPEARSMLLAIDSASRANGYLGLLAKTDWALSLTEAAAGSWGMAIHYAEQSTRTFHGLGETANRANVDLLLGDLLDRSGQSPLAWSYRPSAFRALSSAGSEDRIAVFLATAVRAAARSDPDAALALADVTVDLLRHQRDPHALALTHVQRARLLAENGDGQSARRAVADAQAATGGIPDPALRARMSALAEVASAMVDRTGSSPQRALGALNDALTFFVGHQEHLPLADIYLQRGRTFASMKDDDAALADFSRGLQELNSQRALLEDAELRSGFYDTEPDLFAETIALHLRRGDTRSAFAVADSARARSLYERLGTPAPQAATTARLDQHVALPPRTALLEYAMLRDRMAIFYVTAGGKTTGVETVNLTGETLRRMVNHFDDLLQRRADVALLQNDAKLLYQSLISPVAPHIAGATEVVIVADRELQALPFAALVNPATRRYLIEEIGVDVAPSATFIERAFGPRQLSPALIVGDPKSDGTPALPDAVREAEAIAGMYSAATLLTGDRATPAHFVDAAQRSGIIHYSGHAQSDTTSADGTLRLAGTERENGVLDASDIARLKLRAAPMVVLAACGTMRGDVDHVEGMPSLARAFLAAGARSVVGTLWEIDDETAAHLFRRFHQQLRAGDSPSAALRQTQLTALNDPDPRLRHPSTWAPLEVLGTVN